MKNLGIYIGILALTLMSFTNSFYEGGNDICKTYFPLEKGTKLTYQNYDSKDKLQSTDYFMVKDVVTANGITTISVEASGTDKKGEPSYETTFEYTCENGVFKISMESMMSPEQMEAYKDMEVTVTQSEIQFPSNMTVGQSLPDADMNVKVASNGMQIMEMNFKISNRKIEAKESITTAAGTFECFKLTQTTNMKMMFINKTFTSVDWITENIGPVRSETYDDKGKLESYRILTNINR